MLEIIVLVVVGALLFGAGYVVGLNRNRAKAKAEIEAIQKQVGDQAKAWLEALKNRLGL